MFVKKYIDMGEIAFFNEIEQKNQDTGPDLFVFAKIPCGLLWQSGNPAWGAVEASLEILPVQSENSFSRFIGSKQSKTTIFRNYFIQTIYHEDSASFPVSGYIISKFLMHGKIGIKQVKILEPYTG